MGWADEYHNRLSAQTPTPPADWTRDWEGRLAADLEPPKYLRRPEPEPPAPTVLDAVPPEGALPTPPRSMISDESLKGPGLFERGEQLSEDIGALRGTWFGRFHKRLWANAKGVAKAMPPGPGNPFPLGAFDPVGAGEQKKVADEHLTAYNVAKQRLLDTPHPQGVLGRMESVARGGAAGGQELAGFASQEVYAAPLGIAASAAVPLRAGMLARRATGGVVNAAENALIEGLEGNNVWQAAAVGGVFGFALGGRGGRIMGAAAADDAAARAVPEEAIESVRRKVEQEFDRQFVRRMMEEPDPSKASAMRKELSAATARGESIAAEHLDDSIVQAGIEARADTLQRENPEVDIFGLSDEEWGDMARGQAAADAGFRDGVKVVEAREAGMTRDEYRRAIWEGENTKSKTLKSGEQRSYLHEKGSWRARYDPEVHGPDEFDPSSAADEWLTGEELASRQAEEAARPKPTAAASKRPVPEYQEGPLLGRRTDQGDFEDVAREARGGAVALLSVGPKLSAIPDPKALSKVGQKIREFVTTTGKLSRLEEPTSVGRKFMDMLKRKTTTAADIAESERLVTGRVLSRTTAADFIVSDFDGALNATMDDLATAGSGLTRADVLDYARDGLEGKNDDLSEISPALRAATKRMRTLIDTLGRETRDSGMISKELGEVIKAGEGSYLNRSFAFFGKPDEWRKIVLEEEPWRYDNMKEFAAKLYPEMSPEELDGVLLGYLSEDPSVFFSGSKGRDTGIFKARKHTWWVRHEDGRERVFLSEARAQEYLDANEKRGAKVPGSGRKASYSPAEIHKEPLPSAVDEFLGLGSDPRARFTRTVEKMALELETYSFLKDVADKGEGTFLFDTPPPGAKMRQIKGGDRNPLAGKYAIPEHAKVIENLGAYQDNSAFGTNPIMRWVVGTNSAVRYWKVVPAMQPQIRNLVSWDGMLRFQGKYMAPFRVPRALEVVAEFSGRPTSKGGRKLKAGVGKAAGWMADRVESVTGKLLRHTFGEMDEAARRQFAETGLELGVLREGARAGDARYDIARISDWSQGGPAERLSRLLKPAQTTYVAADDIGKTVHWMAEMVDYAQAKGWDLKTPEGLRAAQEFTAPIVRDLSPTYSKAPKAVGVLKDFPGAADYPTFTAEMVRTTKNTILQAAAEVRDPNPRVKWIGIKRVSGMLATTLGTPRLSRMMLRQRNGMTDVDEELARLLGPEYGRHSDYIGLRIEGEDAQFIDMSYSDARAFIKEWWHAISDPSVPFDEAMVNSMIAPMEALYGEAMVMGTIMDIARNKTPWGRPISLKHDTFFNAVLARAKYADRLMPGEYLKLRRELEALTIGVNPETGYPRSIRDELLARGIPTRLAEINRPGARITHVNYRDGYQKKILGQYNQEVRNAAQAWKDTDSKDWMPVKRKMRIKRSKAQAALDSWKKAQYVTGLLQEKGYDHSTLWEWKRGRMSDKNFDDLWFNRPPNFEALWEAR